MILSATLLPYDPTNLGIVEVQLVLDNGETDSVQIVSGLGNPSSRCLDHFGISLKDFQEDCLVYDDHGTEIRCSDHYVLGGDYETDVDFDCACMICESVIMEAQIKTGCIFLYKKPDNA